MLTRQTGENYFDGFEDYSGDADSQVLGDLASKGIRNGSNDSFTQKEVATGQAALQQYLQSGLVSIGSDAKLTSQLNSLLKPDGATLTVRDANGNVSLTVAGQAKVQEVFNTLKVSETFDTKKFADQGTAQIVTLVAAIVLTVCTAGAGAASLGAVVAGANTLGAAMINAAVIAMSSTMIGQMAGGASFNDAFKAGVKAGATAAATAGILNAPVIDTAQGMQSLNQLANVQTTGANIVGSFNADTFGQNLLGMAGRGVVNAGVNQLVYGKEAGSFGDAFKASFVSDLAAVGANAVGQGAPTLSPQNIIGHAAVGALAAKVTGKDAAAGAIGGATAAVVNPLLDNAIGGTDGSGWGSDLEVAKAMQSGTLQLASMAASAGIASAAGKDGMTAAQAAQNETLNNYLTRNQIESKEKALAAAKTEADKQKIQSEYATLDVKQREAAVACLLGGNCASVTDPAAIKGVLAELNAACAPPRMCSVEAKAGIAELNGLYIKQEALKGVPLVEALAFGGAAQGARAFWSTQIAKIPASDLTAGAISGGMSLGGGIGMITEIIANRNEVTPASLVTAFAAGALGSGVVKQGMNYGAGLANTAIPFTWPNALTQATGAAFGFGIFGWMNTGGITRDGSSWVTSPVLK